MHQLNKTTLSSITGGYSFYRGARIAPIASVAQVLENSHDVTPRYDESNETEPYGYRHIHQPVSPKNGDRNALGQQYSWGTWWDDTH